MYVNTTHEYNYGHNRVNFLKKQFLISSHVHDYEWSKAIYACDVSTVKVIDYVKRFSESLKIFKGSVEGKN